MLFPEMQLQVSHKGVLILPEDIDRPPAGTACATCKAMGHYCSARVFVGQTDVGVCEPCLREENCPVIAALNKTDEPMYEPEEGISTFESARSIPRDEWPDDEIVKQSTTETEDDWTARKERTGRPGMSPELREKILAEPITVTNVELAKKYGMNAGYLGKLRREAGIITPGMAASASLVKAKTSEPPAEPSNFTGFSMGGSYSYSAKPEPLSSDVTPLHNPAPEPPAEQVTIPKPTCVMDLDGWDIGAPGVLIACPLHIRGHHIPELCRCESPGLCVSVPPKFRCRSDSNISYFQPPKKESTMPNSAAELRDKRNEQIKDQLLAGEPILAIARFFGMTDVTIRNVRRMYEARGVKFPPTPPGARPKPKDVTIPESTTPSAPAAAADLPPVEATPQPEAIVPAAHFHTSNESPYAAVRRDLVAKRALIDNAIAALEALVPSTPL